MHILPRLRAKMATVIKSREHGKVNYRWTCRPSRWREEDAAQWSNRLPFQPC